MNRTFLCAVYCLFLVGCVVGSSNPFYTPDLVVDMPELNGTWYFDESIAAKDESPLVLSNGKMTIYDNQGVPADVKVTFFKIDDVVFIDIFPNEGKLKDDLVGDNPPVHLISQVKMKDGKVSFNPLDYEWLAKEVDAGKIDLPHHRVDKDADILFTASPAQWVEFLRAHKDDPLAFPPDREAWMNNKPPQEKMGK